MSVSPLNPAEPEPLRYARKYAIHTLASCLLPRRWRLVHRLRSPCAREAGEHQGCGERKQVAVAVGSQRPPFLDSIQEVKWKIAAFSASRLSATTSILCRTILHFGGYLDLAQPNASNSALEGSSSRGIVLGKPCGQRTMRLLSALIGQLKTRRRG